MTALDTTHLDRRQKTAHRIGLRVPDLRTAADHLSAIVGVAAVDPGADTVVVYADPVVQVDLLPAVAADRATVPRVVDLGTHHLCWRVTDIDAAAAYIDAAVPGATILGDIITVPEGTIAGNRWVYYRSPWGVLFELQQWPLTPPYTAQSAVRLDHTPYAKPAAPLPGYAGVDHTGYSVRDLDAAISYLSDRHGAGIALRTEIEAGRDFMRAQFGIDVEGTSLMAMVVVDGLTIELFEHHVDGRRTFPAADTVGDHTLTLRGSNENVDNRFGATR